MTKKQRAVLAIDKLKELYPIAECSLTYHKERPYELLIATRLSAQCKDERVNIVTDVLFERYQTLEEMANAKVEDVQQILRSLGLYVVKSKDVVLMSQQLIEWYGGELPDTIEELIKLSGIGRKTANLIVGDIFGKPAIVCDTHCMRICGKLGITDGSKDALKVEKQLKVTLDPLESNDFCHRLVLFGRETCSARSPKCDICKLSIFCKDFKKK